MQSASDNMVEITTNLLKSTMTSCLSNGKKKGFQLASLSLDEYPGISRFVDQIQALALVDDVEQL